MNDKTKRDYAGRRRGLLWIDDQALADLINGECRVVADASRGPLRAIGAFFDHTRQGVAIVVEGRNLDPVPPGGELPRLAAPEIHYITEVERLAFEAFMAGVKTKVVP
jgi:hypothetical protein